MVRRILVNFIVFAVTAHVGVLVLSLVLTQGLRPEVTPQITLLMGAGMFAFGRRDQGTTDGNAVFMGLALCSIVPAYMLTNVAYLFVHYSVHEVIGQHLYFTDQPMKGHHPWIVSNGDVIQHEDQPGFRHFMVVCVCWLGLTWTIYSQVLRRLIVGLPSVYDLGNDRTAKA